MTQHNAAWWKVSIDESSSPRAQPGELDRIVRCSVMALPGGMRRVVRPRQAGVFPPHYVIPKGNRAHLPGETFKDHAGPSRGGVGAASVF